MNAVQYTFRSSCIGLFLIATLLYYTVPVRIVDKTQYNSSNCIKYSASGRDSSSACRWIFDHYSPSAWESFWFSHIDDFQTKVCSILLRTDQVNNSIRSLEKIIQLQKTLSSDVAFKDEDKALFSKMFYRYECTQSSTQNVLITAQYIEPLIGLLRDPLTMCPATNNTGPVHIQGGDAIESKRFLLLGPSAPYNQSRNDNGQTIAPWLYQPGTQKILFDIGASLFNGQDHPELATQSIGARWFYEYFKSLSLQFDRIVAFEYREYAPKIYWRQIPEDLMGKLVFINVGVEEMGKFNPWNILQKLAKKEDYVIVKLDIDTPPLEMALINQLLDTVGISSLIDEMFFEMHVTVTEMRPHWGNPGGTLKDTYSLFNKLRNLGIRMHSWP